MERKSSLTADRPGSARNYDDVPAPVSHGALRICPFVGMGIAQVPIEGESLEPERSHGLFIMLHDDPTLDRLHNTEKV